MMSEVLDQPKPKRASKPKPPVGESTVDGEPSTYAAGKPTEVPVFRRGDRVDYWAAGVDGNLEAFVADVIKVFAPFDGEPQKYWVNVQFVGSLDERTDVVAAAVPKNHTITVRE